MKPKPTADEELETGEPLPEPGPPAQTPPPAKKIQGLKGFSGKPVTAEPEATGPVANAGNGQGQMVLSSAKYMKSTPEQQLARQGKKTPQKEAAELGQTKSLEGSVFNSGVAGGLLAMGGAVVWFVVGLANDTLFFYPPILFVIGLAALMKGLMGNKE